MWYSGYPINYYYFGHLIFALIIKVSTVASAIGYNLSVATLFALTFTSAFSLASNFVFTHSTKFKLRRVILAGLLSALLLTLGGNLHAVYKIAKINIKNEGRLVLTRAALASGLPNHNWYPMLLVLSVSIRRPTKDYSTNSLSTALLSLIFLAT